MSVKAESAVVKGLATFSAVAVTEEAGTSRRVESILTAGLAAVMHEDTLGAGAPPSLLYRVSGTVLEAGSIEDEEPSLADPAAVVVPALLTLGLAEGA